MSCLNTKRDWLIDRIHGKSRVGSGRPPCFVCYPPPLIKCCPWLLEDNCVCKAIGWTGCVPSANEAVRDWLSLFAFLANLLALNCFIYAAMGVATSRDILKRTPWSVGIVTTKNDAIEFAQVTLRVGLRAVVLRDDATGEDRSILFDEFCDLTGRGIDNYVKPEDCDVCADASRRYMVIPLLIAVVFCVPSLVTDIMRQYSNYDINFGKCWAITTCCVSIAGAVLTYYFYYQKCLPTFLDEDVLFPDADQDDPNIPTMRTYEWTDAIGMYCIFVAIGLRSFSCIMHCVLPTPSITRDKREQDEYELIQYKKYRKEEFSGSAHDYDSQSSDSFSP
mmetsp:Transcript_9871/g.27962  ORF Transcript_9871/g.27962 Transcript_9871/m.27962 type:complete len:334 (+) Transcript_9871:87-1088(+)